MDNYSSEVVDFYVENRYYEEALLLLRPYMNRIRGIMINFTVVKDHPLISFMDKLCPGVKYYIESYYRFLSREEISSDITICMLTLINRYENQDKCFLGYMNIAFPYEYCRMLMKQNRDILNHYGVKAFFDDGDANLIDEASNIDNFINIFDGIEDEFGYLTDKWTTTRIIDSPFKEFTRYDKEILLSYYQNKKADVEIAATLNKHINTINQHRRYCIKRLEKELKIKHVRTRMTKSKK